MTQQSICPTGEKKIALFHLYNSAAHVGTMAPSFEISRQNIQHLDLDD